MNSTESSAWASGVQAITLFVEDIKAAKEFYTRTFGLPISFENEDSAVFNFGNVIINLLAITSAAELIDPATVASREAGSRVVFTVEVDDVDSVCEDLAARGVKLLNGPTDRPWGMRAASFRDPGGHIWEIAS